AARAWEAPMRIVAVPPARSGSWEDILHRAGPDNKLLLFAETDKAKPLLERRGHRAIGVVYRPEHEHLGNYVPTILPRRYDAFLYIDETRALHPLPVRAHKEGEVPETFPSGV